MSKKQPKKEAAPAAEVGPAVERDHDVDIVTAEIKSFSLPAKSDKTNKKGKIVITDTAGNDHEAVIPNRTMAIHALKEWYGANSRRIGELLKPSEQKNIPGLTKGTRRFKIRKGELFAVVSHRYKPLNIEDVEKAVKKALPKAKDFEVVPSTGTHGGSMRANLGNIGPAQMFLKVDAGPKDGRGSVTVFGEGMVLACKNQLTLKVGGIVEAVRKRGLWGASVHLKTPVQKILETVADMEDIIRSFEKMSDASKGIKVSADFAKEILAYYVRERVISQRVADKAIESFADPKIAQEPGTLYGLIMAATWLGTNADKVKEGVQANLRRVGGELFLVAEHWEVYRKQTRAVSVEAQ
jgi:hypothetical protein